MGKIFYIMGKSASGKDHFYRSLLENKDLSLKPFVIYTTRPMREGEVNGREYYFTDERHLDELRDAGKIIEERVYHTVNGPWYYFTADDGNIDLSQERGENYLAIGTPESFVPLRQYFGTERTLPIYIETDDGIRLERAMKREKKQANPDYAEMCRRFLADTEDFSEENLARAGITRRFLNNGLYEDCLEEIADYVRTHTGTKT